MTTFLTGDPCHPQLELAVEKVVYDLFPRDTPRKAKVFRAMNDALAFRFAGETDVKTVDFFGLITSINAGIDAPEKAQAFGNVARKALG